MHEAHKQIVDPHTADGLKVAMEHITPGEPMLVLETALAVKFSDTIVQAIHLYPEMPEKFKDLEKLDLKFDVMKPSTEQMKSFIASHCDN